MRLSLGVFLAVAISAAPACGSTKSELEERYAAMKSAMAAHDAAAIRSILAPGFVSVDISGASENADQMITEVAALPPDPNKVSQTTLLSVSLTGNDVIVKQQYDMKTTRTGSDGTPHKVELITVSTDTWAKSENTWLMERTVTDSMKMYRDGQLAVQKP